MWNVYRIYLRILLSAISLIVSACNPLASKNSVDANFNPGLGTSTNATIAIVPLISFTAPSNGSFVNAATDSAVFPVLGNCDQAGAVVTVKLDGVTIASPVCTGVSFSTTMNTTGLAISAHTLTASISNAVGTSTASASFSRDLTAPAAAATALGWAQTSPWNTPTASWTLSVAGDIGNQKIQYYTGGACGATSGGLVDVASATATTSVFFSGVDATTYTYKVITYDAAGNGITSACSSAMVIDKTVPSVSVTSLNSGGTYAGGSSQTITYTATDTNLGATPVTLKYSLDNGVTYSNIVANVANAGTYAWTLPAANSNQVRVQVYVVDQAGNIGTATTNPAFTIDSVAPAFTASAMSINGGAATTSNNYVQVSLQAADALSNITHFCLKYNDTATPTSSASCWIAVNAPSPGLTPSVNLNLSGYYFAVGFITAAYNVYAWAKDAAGNISTLSNAGAGTAAKDLATITYNQPSPPTVSNILATNSDAPSNPPSGADLTITAGQNVFIKWRATDLQGFGATPISLYYTTDDSSWTLIAANLANAQNGSCSVNNAGTTADDNDTGCYYWSAGSPVSTYYKVRVVAENNVSVTAAASSVPINTSSSIHLLAGNTDPGIGYSAKSAVFRFFRDSYSDAGSFAINSKGVMYFRDKANGILRVDPANGVVQQLFAWNPSGSNTFQGDITGVTVKTPYKITLDYLDRLLIWDYDRIRRVDFSVSPAQITTVIGGGASTADGVAPTAVQMTPPTVATDILGNWDHFPITRSVPFVALPNGNIIFKSDTYGWGRFATGALGGFRVRVFNSAGNTVTSIYPSGTGNTAFPAQDLTKCYVGSFAFAFDPVSSAITQAQIVTDHYYSGSPPAGCGDNANDAFSNLDTTTFLSTATIPPKTTSAYDAFDNGVVARDGNLYRLSGYTGRIFKYNPGTNNWTTILGTGTIGSCTDGTLATACNVDIHDAWVTETGKIYFTEHGLVRVIDGSGQVKTIFGQPLSYGDTLSAIDARFNNISKLQIWNDAGTDKIVVMDQDEYLIRELAIGGAINKIAGNGIYGTQATGVDAKTTTLRAYLYPGQSNSNFGVNPANGNVYHMKDMRRLSMLNRATGMWSDVTGAAGTQYEAADGIVGSSVYFNASEGGVIGFGAGKVALFGQHYTTPVSTEQMLKLYDSTDSHRQSSLLGTTGAGSTTGLCADGTALNSCASGYAYSNTLTGEYDATNSRWLLWSYAATNKIRTATPGGNIGTLTTTASAMKNFAYRADSNSLYYCSAANGRIYKRDITGGTEVALAWPIAGMSCTGINMYYSPSRNSLIFIYLQNSLAGIAEYLNP